MMTRARNSAGRFRRHDERGATATEYGLLMGFIAMVVVFGIGAFGTAVDAWFGRLAAAVAAIL